MKKRKVEPIENGTVLDHLPAKSALQVLKILNLDFESPVEILINVNSKTNGKKDIIFIENKEITIDEIKKIGLIAMDCTWNIIENKTVTNKQTIKLPENAKNIIICPNSKCITNYENIDTKFKISSENVTCEYCNRVINNNELSKHFK